MEITTLDALFEHELKDIYDAEKRLTKALPKMAKGTEDEELRSLFEEHLQVTNQQIQRLEQIFELLEIKPKAKSCAGMKGLIEEGEEILGEKIEGDLGALAIAGAARKVENYEITAYRSLQSMAELIGDQEVQDLIDETLREEEDAEQRLSAICDQLLQNTAGEDEEEDEEMIDDDDDDDMLMEDEEEEVTADEPVPASPRQPAHQPAKKK
jgi:ferritin-like metal-binding protein YciE